MSTTCSRIDKLPTAGTDKLTNAGGGGGGVVGIGTLGIGWSTTANCPIEKRVFKNYAYRNKFSCNFF